MKVLHVADIHLGMTNMASPGNPDSRLDDLDEALNRFCGIAAREKPDLVLIVGDLFDKRDRRESKVLAVATRFLSQLDLIAPWRLLDGNHDGRTTISDPRSASLRFLSELTWEQGGVITDPRVTEVVSGEQVAVLVSVPYPHKRAYDVVRSDLDEQARHEQLSRDLEGAIEGLYQQAVTLVGSKDWPIIFAGHLTAVGSTVGSERTMRLENDVTVGTHVLDLFDYAALGHVHVQQRVGRKAWYPGAPEYVNFGEAGQTKGFLLAEVERGEDPKVKVIPAKPRPMELFEGDAGDDGTFEAPNDLAPGAMVRLRLHYRDRIAARASKATEADFYAKGASYVQIEVLTPERAAPTERALATTSTPVEALDAYLKQRGLDPTAYLAAFQSLLG